MPRKAVLYVESGEALPVFRDLERVRIICAATTDDGQTVPAGSEGTIVDVVKEGLAYTVEFSAPVDGLATLLPHELRPLESANNQRPPVENDVLSSPKITQFILKQDHKDNKGRYKIFPDFGFKLSEPHILAQTLLKHHHTAHRFALQNGRVRDLRLVLDGPIETPDGRGANVRTVWNFDDGKTARFITVMPLPRRIEK